MNRLWLAALLALPIAGLAVGIATRETALEGATEWRIPVSGYDPLDPIRGHYIEFVYDWKVAGDGASCKTGTACELCLGLPEDDVTVTVLAPDAQCANRIDVAASGIAVMGPPPRFASRVFVSELRAPGLDQMLRTQPMVVVARLTSGGRLVNERIEPANPIPTGE